MIGHGGALLFGATGYSGRLILDRLLQLGQPVTLAARSANALRDLSLRAGAPALALTLEQPERLIAALRGFEVVINAAGPFRATATPMVEACLAARTHYLDITGEIEVFERLRGYDRAARKAGIMIMPGVGFEVACTDSLCRYIVELAPGADRLVIGVAGLELVTRGSALTLLDELGRPTIVRRQGRLVAVPPGSLRRSFDFGAGRREALAVSWGDVSTAYYSTGVPNVEVYFEATPALEATALGNRLWGGFFRSDLARPWLEAQMRLFPGPSDEQRRGARTTVVVESFRGSRRVAAARLSTRDAYSATALVAAIVAQKALRGDLELGFQTPGRVYGPGLALEVEGSHRVDLDPAGTLS